MYKDIISIIFDTLKISHWEFSNLISKKNSFKRINIILKVQNIDEKLINFIQELIINYEGKSQVEFLIEDETEKQNVKLFSKKNKVRIEQTLLQLLDKIPEIKYIV